MQLYQQVKDFVAEDEMRYLAVTSLGQYESASCDDSIEKSSVISCCKVNNDL